MAWMISLFQISLSIDLFIVLVVVLVIFFLGLFWVFGGDLWLLWVIVVFVLVVSGGFSFDWWWWQLSLGGLLPWVCRFMVVGVCRGGLGGGGLLW